MFDAGYSSPLDALDGLVQADFEAVCLRLPLAQARRLLFYLV